MSNPFTRENHLEFMAERRRINAELHTDGITKLYKDPSVRALDRMMRLSKKYNKDMAKVRAVMGREQYNLADNEFVARAGDPNRFDEETGGWIIWP